MSKISTGTKRRTRLTILGACILATAGLVALAAAAGGLLLFADDGAAPAEAAATPAAKGSAEVAYADLVERPVTRLSQSATSVGQVLATAARPRDITRLSTVVRRQLKVVQANRRVLAGKEIAAADRAAHNRLLRAAALHKRFLELLVRTTALEPALAREQLPVARATAARSVSFYRAFFRQTPELPNLVSDTGLADLSGLRTALAEQEAIDEEETTIEEDQTQPTPEPTETASAYCAGDLTVGPNTSCAFAENVQAEYYRAGAGWIYVYSPVTGRLYDMYCTSTSPHVCTGGNNAAVHFP